jgi:hypothetical protein
VRPVDSVSPVGDFLGKATVPLSFAEAVRSPHSFPALGGRSLVPSLEAGPLVKDCCVDGSSAQRCRGCREACSVGCLESYPAATALLTTSRQGNPLGEEDRVVTASPLGSLSVSP